MPKPVKLRRYDRKSKDVALAGRFAESKTAESVARILNNIAGDDYQYFVADTPEEEND